MTTYQERTNHRIGSDTDENQAQNGMSEREHSTFKRALTLLSCTIVFYVGASGLVDVVKKVRGMDTDVAPNPTLHQEVFNANREKACVITTYRVVPITDGSNGPATVAHEELSRKVTDQVCEGATIFHAQQNGDEITVLTIPIQ